MSFNSLSYLLFLPFVLFIYWGIPFWAQNCLLLAASYFFLGFIHPWYVILIFFVSISNYSAARAIEKWPAQKKYFLLLSLICSLGMLGFFKYANFFLDNVRTLLEIVGLPTFTTTLSILLPVGISFYTFQAIAYTVDVYRKVVKPQHNIIHFLLFLSFFPQLVAGPIERSARLMPQIENPRHVTPELLNHGLMLLLWGFFKKLVIADNTGLIAYKIFALEDPGFYMLWVGVFAFSIQILADFWSYTDIARGSALLLGFRLSRNFDHPYFSTSPADFWRRWHITLSYWLRDYVYIPLGGSRVNKRRAGINIMVTFLLSGLWHGASWNFVLWGGYHGILVLVERWCRTIWASMGLNSPRKLSFGLLIGRRFITFLLICFGWLIFRVTDTGRIVELLSLAPWHADMNDIHVAQYLFLLTLLYSLPIWIHGFFHFQLRRRYSMEYDLPPPVLMARPVLMSLLFLGILTLRSPEPSTFIYFQF